MLAVIMMASNAHAGNRGQYLKSSEMPNALLYLPPPPDTTMLAINGDYARWIWGKSVRPTPRGEMADDDEIFGIVRMCPIFSDILGIEINEENTPAIYRLMNNSGDTGSLSCLSMQQTYFRKRPFLLMNESTWGAHDLYDDLSRKSSYPSYHTGSGWGTTLALAEMAPHLQDTILRRGYEYGISRVIVGAHWQSDVDAAILCASAAIARSHATAAYQADLAAARSEYMQLTGLSESQINGSTTPSALKILDAPAMADSYFYYGDVAPYWQAMGDRDSERGAQAIIDSNLNDLAVINGFAECTGTEITSSTTPCISALIKSSKHYIEQQANAMNGDWYRPHPYVQLADTTMLPNEEDSHSNESSYPSLQAMVGWGLALLLTEVMPDCQNQILKHGYEMGWSSVITGYHYPTDVQAARVMAAGLITKMHNETKFKNMLRAARQEYANLATKNINSTPSATYSSLLTSPPDSASVAFAADFYRWIWGKGIRNTELGEIARHDSQCNIDHLCGIYSEILGININKKSSPAIYNMISQAAQAGSNSTQAISTNHQRQQPFVLMNEQPWGINESSSPTSHPSSHASMVWSTALAVAQLAPQLQDTILSRALQCASSGVITGNCWQSDVDNAFYCGSLAMALLRSKNNFTTLAEEAQNEYLQLSGLSIDDLNSQFPSSTILETPAGVDNLHFFYDLSNYWKGKAMRNTERGRLANEDASTENSYLLNTFNNCVSTIDISESNTPYIATLIGMLKLTLNGHTTNLKNSSNRFRPFRQFSETIPYGGEAWQHYSESSYPSRHALLGWGIALVLAEVMPDCHSAIIKRGYEYGESRVITGLSYASDARDARIIAATVTNKLHNIPLFATLIHEAKAEYMRLKRPFGDVNGDFAVTSADIMVLYNWLLNNDSGNIVDGDLDGDGTITAADITIIYNILLGQNSEK
jgi:acid phosphatase (class A)